MPYREHMLTNTKGLIQLLDQELIGFLTAVKENGQPQTSPVWFHRDGEDLVVYNRPTARRLRSIASNPLVSLALRADREGHSLVSIEGSARVDRDLPTAEHLAGYVDKYAAQIEGLGSTPASFSIGYSIPLRIAVTRVRASGIDRLLAS